MPELIVKIIWDWPEDPYWLNQFNLTLALAKYCPNTAFEVMKWPPSAHDIENFYEDEEDVAPWEPPNNAELFDLLEGP